MIVVFVVDTSPSMGRAAPGNIHSSAHESCGLTRLDIAKMTVETITKALNRRIQSHNNFVSSYNEQQSESTTGSLHQVGLGGYASQDHFLLLRTGFKTNLSSENQIKGSSYSTIAGRIVVDYGTSPELPAMFELGGDASGSPSHYQKYCASLNQNHASFDKALKHLIPTTSFFIKDLNSEKENEGGVPGLNAALSAGLQLMSRYRLHNRWTENFGLGRLPSPAIITHGALGVYGAMNNAGFTSSVHQATQALQPACLILLTDGECLNQPPELGGGTLQLQFGNLSLREFYKEREFIY